MRFAATVAAATVFWLLCAPGFHAAPVQAQSARVLILHEFTASDEGWRVSGDSVAVDAIFRASGGHPGGCIGGVDEALGETWYFRAPSTVLEQLPRALDGTIRFSLKQSGRFTSLNDDDVVIVGQTGRLSYRFSDGPRPDWTDFAVRLSEEAGWTWNWNARATRAQIASVLAAPIRLDIRGEYVTGDDEGFLDNFAIAFP